MSAGPPPTVSLREATRFWAKLGWINFGGPAGQIALMHEELVTRRRWIGEERFLHALNYCMLLPGPEAQQLATYVGWLLHRARGGLLAGTLFVLPGALVLFLLSWLYAAGGHLEWIAAIFYGLRAGVVAIVAAALLRIASRALRTPASVALALGAWLALFLFGVPFPALIAAAGVVGAWLGRSPRAFGRAGEPEPSAAGLGTVVLADDAPLPAHAHPSSWRLARTLVVGLLAWWLPLLAVISWRGPTDTASREAIFFSQAAVVTFGGAYAVLGYVQQAAVERFGWLLPGQMLDGLGLAETTPGPLILVLEFVGFLGGWRNPGDLSPFAAGALGAAVTLWATFAPCFLWIFAGAPYLERLRREPRLAGALQAITAAVVGVIANLALWFAIHALFRDVGTVQLIGHHLPAPRWGSLDLVALGLATAAFVCIRRLRWNVIAIVAGCALAGWLATLAGWR